MIDSAMPTRKYGYKNIYTCPKCGGQTVTIDVDEGVTPFMLRCRATGQEGDCDGMAQSCWYRVPADSPEPQWEWFKPCGSEYQKLSRQMRDHVDKGGLDIRRKRGYVNPDEEIKGYFRDSYSSLLKKISGSTLMATAQQPASHSASNSATQTPSPTEATPVAVPPMLDVPTHPVQTKRVIHSTARCPQTVTMRAYEVYCYVCREQAALVTGGCHGGFGAGELIAFLYAHSFPKSEWRARVDEAFHGMTQL